MQRFYGAFPRRAAGVALLLLRIAVAVTLVSQASTYLPAGTELFMALYVVGACFLVVGLYTPIVALAMAAMSVGTIGLHRELPTWGLPIAILIAVTLLGPGSYSVDAKLYGRRRLVIRSIDNHDVGPHDADG